MHYCRCVLDARRFVSVCLVVALAGCCCAAPHVAAYTPDSPLVRTLRGRAIERITNADHEELGGKCLLATAFYNEKGKKDHPKIQRAVAACQKAIGGITPEQFDDSIYSTTIACIFLAELDAEKYRAEIDVLWRSLELRQRPYGAWGYPKGGSHPKTGDTSMTQYGVLCLWTLNEQGVPISVDTATKACNWLLRTQDPSGAWGYQGNDPGVGGQPRSRPQSKIRHSMAAAGVGSLYVLADFLKLLQARKQSINSTTPSVLRKAPAEIAGGPLSGNVDKAALRSAIDLGDAWFEKNLTYDGTNHTYYYMYAMERYQAFREKVTGRREQEPHWYNAGVEFLRKEQKANGSWRQGNSEAIDTAFALLFLQRSTRKKIDDSLYDGTLRAGNGLPPGPWKLGKDGRIEQQKTVGLAEEILKRLENDADLEWTPEQAPDVQLSDDPDERAAQIERLERLVRAAKFQPRFVAVKTLSRARDLDHVPALIYALSDPDPQIRQQSRAGLRFISRRFGGFGLPDDPSEPDKQTAISKWKHWYSSVRPDAEFRE